MAPEAGTYWAYPAVSPDGRWIAASRWTDRRHDVVILDADGGVADAVTRDRALDLAPKWNADGRYLVWSSDRSGIPNILGAEVDPLTGAAASPVMLTNVRTGAAFPSIDPAGEWLYFSGYHVDGWEVERVRFAPAAALPAPAPAARFDEAGAVSEAATGDASAWLAGPRGSTAAAGPGPVMPPAAHRPVLGRRTPPTRLERRPATGRARPTTTHRCRPCIRGTGCRCSGSLWRPPKTTVGGVEVPRTEILGYALRRPHLGASISPAGMPTNASGASGLHVVAAGERATCRHDHRGLGNPTIGVTASQTWDDDGVRVRRPATGAEGSPATFFVLERERRLATSVRVHRPGVRMSTSLRFSAGLVRSDREVLDKALRSTDGFATLRGPAASLRLRRTTPLPVCRKRPRPCEKSSTGVQWGRWSQRRVTTTYR